MRYGAQPLCCVLNKRVQTPSATNRLHRPFGKDQQPRPPPNQKDSAGLITLPVRAPEGGPGTKHADTVTRVVTVEHPTLNAHARGNLTEQNQNKVFNISVFPYYLQGYPPDSIVFLVEGFSNGFKIGFSGPNLNSASKINRNPSEVDEMISKELAKNRIAGHFDDPPFNNFEASPLALIPKRDGKFRLIHNFSFPHNSSVNTFINKNSTSVKYESFDYMVSLVRSLSKTDIEKAFRFIPIHPSDYQLLGFNWRGTFYHDKRLAMGFRSSCAIFEKFSCCALQRICKNKLDCKSMSHILDDFIFLGPGNSNACSRNLNTFLDLAQLLNIPIKHEKTVEPTTELIVHGIEIDSQKMEFRLLEDKIIKVREILQFLGRKKKVILRELQPAIGLLQFACKAILPGRAFYAG